MKKLIPLTFILACFFAFGPTLQAQMAPVKLWDKTFGGNGIENIYSVEQTIDGGYILGSNSTSGLNGDKSEPGKGGYDCWVIKLDSSGNKIWDKTFGGSEDDLWGAIQQTPDGGYILVSNSKSGISTDKTQNSKGGLDFWILKLDVNGAIVWDKTYGGNADDVLYAFQQTTDGGLILAGKSESYISGDKSQSSQGYSDYWVLKLDGQGNKVWDKTFGGKSSERAMEVKQTSDGGFIIGGESLSGAEGNKSQPAHGHLDYWVLKLDFNGNKVWDKSFGGNKSDNLYSILETSDGGFLLGGFSESDISSDKSQPSKGKSDIWLIKIDASGSKLWDKVFGSNDYDFLITSEQTLEGGFLLGGYSYGGISGDKSEASKGDGDYWILKLDVNGNKLWDKAFGGSKGDFLTSIFEASDGSYILGGFSESGVSGDKTQNLMGVNDIWIIKLTAPCTALMATIIPTCSNSTTNLDLKITGIQNGTNGTQSWTLTYMVNGSMETIIGSKPNFSLVQNAPIGTVFTLLSITSGACFTNLNQSFTISDVPPEPIVAYKDGCGELITYSAIGATENSEYRWYDIQSGGKAIIVNKSGLFTIPNNNASPTYYVAATNNAGCEGPRTPVTVSFRTCPPPFIPNIVTQNQDGLNDTFKPQNLPTGKWELQIYNRWGKRIYETEDYQNTWPETTIIAGTYYYRLQNPETGQKFKGWVEVTK